MSTDSTHPIGTTNEERAFQTGDMIQRRGFCFRVHQNAGDGGWVSAHPKGAGQERILWEGASLHTPADREV